MKEPDTNEMNNNARNEYKKTMNRRVKKRVRSITIVLSEDTYDKALTAFNMAVAGAELGMNVYMFFTSRGVNVVKKAYKPRRARWGEVPIAIKESSIRSKGGPVLAHLMYQARDMGVHMYVCYTSMISMGLKKQMIVNGVRILRMAEFLDVALETDAQFVFS